MSYPFIFNILSIQRLDWAFIYLNLTAPVLDLLRTFGTSHMGCWHWCVRIGYCAQERLGSRYVRSQKATRPADLTRIFKQLGTLCRATLLKASKRNTTAAVGTRPLTTLTAPSCPPPLAVLSSYVLSANLPIGPQNYTNWTPLSDWSLFQAALHRRWRLGSIRHHLHARLHLHCVVRSPHEEERDWWLRGSVLERFVYKLV